MPPSPKLPGIGVSIFSTMTRLANERGAINLSQGFPDFDCDPALVEAVCRHMTAGHNQYAPMSGVARPMNEDWVRDIRDRCRRARVPFFFKQWGGVHKSRRGRTLDNRTWDEFPEVPRRRAEAR